MFGIKDIHLDKIYAKSKKEEQKKDLLDTHIYFGSPVYWMDKPEWVKPLIKATDPYIKIAKKK